MQERKYYEEKRNHYDNCGLRDDGRGNTDERMARRSRSGVMEHVLGSSTAEE